MTHVPMGSASSQGLGDERFSGALVRPLGYWRARDLPGRFPHCLPDPTVIKHFLLFSPVFFFLNFKPLVLVLPKIYY